MSEDADIGHGFCFERGDRADPIVFAEVGEVVEPMLPKLQRDAVESTHAKSPDRYREFIGGLSNAEEFSITLNYNPGNTAFPLLLSDFANKLPNDYRGTLPDTSTWQFSALLVGVGQAIPVGDKMQLELTFKPTGKPVFTVAA
jgi:hypothetical protein